MLMSAGHGHGSGHKSGHGGHGNGHGHAKPKDIDELMEQLKHDHAASLDDAFAAHDAFTKEEHQNHLYNRILVPAHQEMYNALSQELEHLVGDDDTKLHKKDAEIRQAVAKGLTKYFEKAQPSIIKVMKDLGMNEDESYDFLATIYDSHIGVDSPAARQLNVVSIRSLESLAKDKKATAGHLKRALYESQPNQVKGALNTLGNKHYTHHFARYHPTEVAAYLKPKLEEAGYDITDKVGFATADLSELLGLRRAAVEKKGHPYIGRKGEAAHDDAHGHGGHAAHGGHGH